MPPIAEGNPTIRINGMLAARIEHKLVCAADITKGSPNVLYGAASEQVLTIIDTEQIFSLIGAGILIAAFGIEAAIIGYVVTSVIGEAADKYLGEGWGDIINGTLGFLALGLGAVASRRAALRETPLEEGVKPKTPEEIAREEALRNISEDRENITRLSDAGDIQGARDILEPHVKAGDINGIIDRLDVSSPKDGAVFWSGDKAAAGEFARQRGGVTLETTSGGRVVDDWGTLNDNLPWDNGGKDFWGGLSDKYSRGASGEVNVVQTAEKAAQGGGYTWKNVEQPILERLQEQGVVTDINTHVLPPK